MEISFFTIASRQALDPSSLLFGAYRSLQQSSWGLVFTIQFPVSKVEKDLSYTSTTKPRFRVNWFASV
jgi:hypothetical protein